MMDWTVERFLWHCCCGNVSADCPPENVNPFRWRAMIRRFEIDGFDGLAALL